MKKERESRNAARNRYYEYYRTLPIDENAAFLEARNGKEADGNIYYIIRELLSCEDYANLKLYVSAEPGEAKEAIKIKLKTICTCCEDRIEIIEVESDRYYRIAASARYIFCDATLRNFFIKKEGQTYINVWHGMPFKVMGRRVIHEPHATGNAQKNFTIADYLLYPNEYMMEHMVEDYMIANTSSARILLGGYPRNTAFFDHERAKEIRKVEGLEEKRVYVYMPTHRPELMGESLERVLSQMDMLLEKDEILFAKVHPLAADTVDFGGLNNIRKFPTEYETYEFLNIADCLITDYSSVFYDFAVTGKKIVLYTYDEEEYLSTRGLYEPMSSLPFVQVKSVENTLKEARTPKNYDDSLFLEKYCGFESAKATEALLKRVIRGESNPRIRELDMPSNGKPNILVWVDSLAPGEKRDALLRKLESADKDRNNWFITFDRAKVKDHKEILLNLPEGIDYFGRAGKPYETGDPEEDRKTERKRCFGDMNIELETVAESLK